MDTIIESAERYLEEDEQPTLNYGKCKDCVYWDKNGKLRVGGQCKRVDFADVDLVDSAFQILDFSEEYGNFDPLLWTGSEFGCVQFKGK